MFRSKLTQLRWLVIDVGLRLGPLVAGYGLAALAFIARPFSTALSYRFFLNASRKLGASWLDRHIREGLALFRSDPTFLVGPACSDAEFLTRAIVLREPDSHGRRKGVLLLKFTTTFPFPLRRGFLDRLMDRFVLVLEPSWAGYADPDILHFTRRPDPVLVQSSESTDVRLLRNLGSNLVPVPLGSGCWVDHRVFRPLPDQPKDVDVVYVASVRAYKRMHAFMRLLRDMRSVRGRTRGVLVCSNWGTSRLEAQRLSRAYGVADDLEILESLSAEALNRVLNRSRFSVLLSLKEGSNKTLFESMLAGTPVSLISENVGVSRAHIPEQAGLVVPEKKLARALAQALEHPDRFSPRAWAMGHISPAQSTNVLAEYLTTAVPELCLQPGELKVKINTPELRYFDDPAPPGALVRRWIASLGLPPVEPRIETPVNI